MSTINNIQRNGSVKFGTSVGALTEYNLDAYSCVFTKTFDVVERGATLGSGQISSSAGNWRFTLEVEYDNNHGSSNLADFFWQQSQSATPSMQIIAEWIENSDLPVSSTNQRVRGTAIIPAVASGGKRGELREQTVTMPFFDVVFLNS